MGAGWVCAGDNGWAEGWQPAGNLVGRVDCAPSIFMTQHSLNKTVPSRKQRQEQTSHAKGSTPTDAVVARRPEGRRAAAGAVSSHPSKAKEHSRGESSTLLGTVSVFRYS